jgi:hypothetical protein
MIVGCSLGSAACHRYDTALLRRAAKPKPQKDAGAIDAGGADSGIDGGGMRRDAAAEACMPAPEACNRVDDDCDGKLDEDTIGACQAIIVNADADCVRFGTSASCALVQCHDGFEDCDGNPANGCEPYCMCHDCTDAGTEADAH